jgi:signal transduction histidine kinase
MTADSTSILLVGNDAAYGSFLVELLGSGEPATRLRHAPSLVAAFDVSPEKFDAALLDLAVGGAAGLDALHAFRGRLPSLPVIVLLSEADAVLASEAIQAGAQDYVVKCEADGRLVLRAIRNSIDRSRTHRELEHRFSQLQRFEAIGRLAGGIAHDFNNLLTLIGGRVERLQRGLAPDDPLRKSVDEVASAADRAAGLTLQLLAFSRRQVLAPKVVSLNAIVDGVHEMLTRLLGEHVSFELALAPDVSAVRADPGRIEQALLNLAINARDAMPDGGVLSVATANVTVDEAYARQHVGAAPGTYVRLTVSDTGTGMDPETRERVFEPFFTTKEVGKGTGLGLSTVYGIVKQSGGHIWVYSEAGLGTTFKIYLPAVDAPIDVAPVRQPLPLPAGSETILLVEDEDGVRELIDELLTARGYHVLAASRGVEALQIAEFVEEDIHLLVTDVVMPQMSGREVVTRLAPGRPNMRVLYLSGYTDDLILQHGALEPGAAFLQKPFGAADLARKVREVLSGVTN